MRRALNGVRVGPDVGVDEVKYVKNNLFGPPSSRNIPRPYEKRGKWGIPLSRSSYFAMIRDQRTAMILIKMFELQFTMRQQTDARVALSDKAADGIRVQPICIICACSILGPDARCISGDTLLLAPHALQSVKLRGQYSALDPFCYSNICH
jgi:hypothetical protein